MSAAAYVVPVFVAAVLAVGAWRGVPLFDTFLEGAADGLRCALKLLPPVAGLILAVSAFEASGALDLLVKALAPAARLLGVPREVMPLALLRPVSGSGALAVLTTIYSGFGPDSPVGRTASVLMGSSETTFYTIAVYYGGSGIKKGRCTLAAALLADLAAFIAASLLVKAGM